MSPRSAGRSRPSAVSRRRARRRRSHRSVDARARARLFRRGEVPRVPGRCRRGRHGGDGGRRRRRRARPRCPGDADRRPRVRRRGAGGGAQVHLQPSGGGQRPRRGPHRLLVPVRLPAHRGDRRGGSCRRRRQSRVSASREGARQSRGAPHRQRHRRHGRERGHRCHRRTRRRLAPGRRARRAAGSGQRPRLRHLQDHRDLRARHAGGGDVLRAEELLRQIRSGGPRGQREEGSRQHHPAPGGDSPHPRHAGGRLQGGAEPAGRGAVAVLTGVAHRPREQAVGQQDLRGPGAGAAPLPLRGPLRHVQLEPPG